MEPSTTLTQLPLRSCLHLPNSTPGLGSHVAQLPWKTSTPHSLTLSLSLSLTHSFTASLSHSITPSFSHSLTHSLTRRHSEHKRSSTSKHCKGFSTPSLKDVIGNYHDFGMLCRGDG